MAKLKPQLNAASTSAHNTAAPDTMRRAPQQLRSRRMVNAIVAAAKKILESDGRKGLSTTSLELVSGVSKASIYQYFPNLDAVVAEVFHDVIHQRLTEDPGLLDSQEISLHQLAEAIVDSALDLHRSLLSLDEGFYRSYGGYYDLWQAFDKAQHSIDASVPFLQKQIARCTNSPADDNTRLQAYALGRSVELTIYTMLRDDPSFLSQPKFRQILIGIAMATVTT